MSQNQSEKYSEPEASKDELSQRRVELLKATASVWIGLAAALIVSALNVTVGVWSLVGPDVVAQIIPVLMIAVILESSFTNLPRRTSRTSRYSYRGAFFLFVVLLIAGEAAAVVAPNDCEDLRLVIQLAALTAGVFTVSSGFFIKLVGSRFPLEIDFSTIHDDDTAVVVSVGGSNRFRATELVPLLNVLVPKGNKIEESNTFGEPIEDRTKFPLYTPETISGITGWQYTAREFGTSGGDSRVSYFRVTRGDPEADCGELRVVARADHQDLKRGREQAEDTFTWPAPADSDSGQGRHPEEGADLAP